MNKDKRTYSTGFNYQVVSDKKYSPAEIIQDIHNWTEQEKEAAFAALAAINYPDNWPQVKLEIESGFKYEQ